MRYYFVVLKKPLIKSILNFIFTKADAVCKVNSISSKILKPARAHPRFTDLSGNILRGACLDVAGHP